jgi:hypothetical protein
MNRSVRIDWYRLNKIAKVQFTADDIHELVDLASDYVRRFGDEPVPDFMLEYAVKCHTTDKEVRRAFVEAFEGIWRERLRRRGRGAYYNLFDAKHTGPLVRLIQHLLRGARDPNPPSAAVLFHDIKFLATGKERNHGKPRKRARR